jgi:hypothetical protein
MGRVEGEEELDQQRTTDEAVPTFSSFSLPVTSPCHHI